MSAVSGENHYLNFIFSPVSFCAEKVNDYLNICADSLAASAVPFVKSGYAWLGETASSWAGTAIDPDAGRWVKEAWTDPLSTEAVLAISNKVEKITEKLAERKPSDNQWFEFLEKSMIGASQQLYVYTKHSNEILRIAPYIKAKIDSFSLERWLQGPRKFFGRSWWWISEGAVRIRQGFFYLIYAVVKVVEYFRPFFIYSYRPEAIKAADKMAKSLVENPRMHLAQAAEQYIVEKEDEVRKDIVENVANAALDYMASLVSRITLKGIVGTLVYYGALKPALISAGLPNPSYELLGPVLMVSSVYKVQKSESPTWQTLKWATGLVGYYVLVKPTMESVGIPMPSIGAVDTAAIIGTTWAIWEWGVKPSLQPYYDSYTKGLVKNSTLLDHCKKYSLSEYYKYFRIFKKAWKGDK